MSGEIVDEIDVGKALAMALRAPGEPAPMACCPRDDEPLIGTMERRGAEFCCLICGNWYGFLSPKPLEATAERTARYDELLARGRTENVMAADHAAAQVALESLCGELRKMRLPNGMTLYDVHARRLSMIHLDVTNLAEAERIAKVSR